jgi:hypothetical protein
VLKPWQRQEGCIPAGSPEFVRRTEDILALYGEPYGPRYSVVCVDGSPDQLVSEARQPLPMVPGQPTRYDEDYRQEGTGNLYMFFQPLKGWRHVKVTDPRTKEFAHRMQELVDVHFPMAALMSVVPDNLHTHTPAPLRKLAFRYPQAWQLAQDGGNRDRRNLQAELGPATANPRDGTAHNHSLANAAPYGPGSGPLALHDCQSTAQAQTVVPITTSVLNR